MPVRFRNVELDRFVQTIESRLQWWLAAVTALLFSFNTSAQQLPLVGRAMLEHRPDSFKQAITFHLSIMVGTLRGLAPAYFIFGGRDMGDHQVMDCNPCSQGTR